MLEEEGADAQLVGDGSVGADQGFIIRRARLIFQGDITDRIGVYLQPDFAATPNGSVDSIQFTQIRDWYSDIHLDDDKVYRFRVGQSKIPYGWENLQSSQNRLPLDRNDALNSAARNERDLGVFYYYTPKSAQELFKYVLDENLKGSGNYGLFGVGFYNGQGGSFREQNDNLHFITRLAVPKALPSGQIVEWGLMGYTGMYSVLGTRYSVRQSVLWGLALPSRRWARVTPTTRMELSTSEPQRHLSTIRNRLASKPNGRSAAGPA